MNRPTASCSCCCSVVISLWLRSLSCCTCVCCSVVLCCIWVIWACCSLTDLLSCSRSACRPCSMLFICSPAYRHTHTHTHTDTHTHRHQPTHPPAAQGTIRCGVCVFVCMCVYTYICTYCIYTHGPHTYIKARISETHT